MASMWPPSTNVIFKLENRMPSSKHFHTRKANVTKFPLLIKVNHYAIHTIWSLHTNCLIIEMYAGLMR